MNRTDAQITADEALANAVQVALEAYGIAESDEMVTEYVVLTVTQKLTDDGTVVTCHPILLKDGDMPWFKILGIIGVHEKIANKIMLEGTDNG